MPQGEAPFRLISSDVKLGRNVRIFSFTNLYGCEIGDDSRVGTFVEIQKGARIGQRCKISSHTFICEGVTIEDEVFIGHNVTFINDRFPKATTPDGALKTDADWKCEPTLVKRGASIGSGATLLGGIVVGEHALVGAGSVVTKDVPAHATVAGNPARVLARNAPARAFPDETALAAAPRDGGRSRTAAHSEPPVRAVAEQPPSLAKGGPRP